MIALDTETTGLDIHHGAKPFFVTTCHEDGTQRWWEWDVTPETREPQIPESDLTELREFFARSRGWAKWDEETRERHSLVLHNAKFDAAALVALLPGLAWPWTLTHDTLFAGHLLASNQPHDLTSMALHYLGVDIEPYEKALEEVCKEARRLVQQAKLRVKRAKVPAGCTPSLFGSEALEDEPLARYRIADADLAEMPSAKEKSWKYDTWLPQALAKELGYPPEHQWRTVLRDYANTDSSVTIMLWKVLEPELKKRGLWKLYQERRKLLPIVYEMERRGVTLHRGRLEQLETEYRAESEKCAAVMTEIASNREYALELPKGAVNNSLRGFCFDVLKLPRVYNGKAKTANPCLDSKNALPHWLEVLPEASTERQFVQALADKRARDTALAYMDGYRRFWLPLESQDRVLHQWFVIHPSLNPTGTDTLRFSSSNPNEQNISKRKGFNLRFCFGPAPGREWWALDYENLELRIPAYESGEKDLIDLFERSEEPPYYGSEHLLNFSVVYPDLWQEELAAVGFDKVGPHIKEKYASTWYQRCKNGDFAVGYGAVDRLDGLGTADRTFGRPGSHARLKSRFAKKEALNQKWIRFAERNGYVETMPDKTVDPQRGYPLLCTRTEWGKVLPTVPLNYHVQGTAMWCTCKAMVRCEEQLNEWNRSSDPRGYWIALQVHDEIVFDLPAGGKVNLPKVRKLQQLMEQSGDDVGVPLRVSVSYHPNNWSEKVKL